MARSVVFVLFLATLAIAQDVTSKQGKAKYKGLQNHMHVFFDSATFSEFTPQQLSDKVKDSLTSAKVDFESVVPMNFDSGDYLNAYVDVTLKSLIKYEME